ncbi:MAG: Enoyl-CoA hydratase, partial [uncultured Solirubrobacteraceae bacterium]
MSIVITEDRGPVRHVVLNRPEKRNALNDELIEGLREAFAAAAADPA